MHSGVLVPGAMQSGVLLCHRAHRRDRRDRLGLPSRRLRRSYLEVVKSQWKVKEKGSGKVIEGQGKAVSLTPEGGSSD